MPPYLKNGTAQFAPISNRSRRSHIIVIVKLSYSNLYCMTLVTDDFLSTNLEHNNIYTISYYRCFLLVMVSKT